MVSDLVRTYLVQTEIEKRERGLAEPASADTLPPQYEKEVDAPSAAYHDCVTLIAEEVDRPVGVVVVRVSGDEAEIKRLWTDPSVRGKGVGGALLDAALEVGGSGVRLSVWHWRAAAIRLYESRGFVPVTSWDDRDGLVCMAHPGITVPLR